MPNITVPLTDFTDTAPTIRLSINGRDHSFPAGEEVTLTDAELAALSQTNYNIDYRGGVPVPGYTVFSDEEGDGFEWDPMGVIFGVDFTTDRVFDGTSVTSDYSTVLGGAFDEDAVSALGMAVGDGVNNYPSAAGPLLDLFKTNDYCLVIFWRQNQLFYGQMIDGATAGGNLYLDVAIDTDETWATDRDGDYTNVGIARAFSDNVLAISLNANGVLASLNGATAVLSEPQMTRVLTAVYIAANGSQGDEVEGWIKALIFYPATNAAGVEAYAANASPTNSVAPAITGTAQQGQTLSITTGTWTGSPTSYQYQWYRSNYNEASVVVGATNNTYALTAPDVGETMKCVVYALNADGIGGVAVTDNTSVATAAPVAAVSPVISGTTTVGQQLSVTDGTWNNGPDSYTYKWIRGFEYIVGAVASTYTLVLADQGEMIACEVTATNEFGDGLGYADAVGPIA